MLGNSAHTIIWQHTHPWLKRTWAIDAEGIHEHRSGRIFASIRWDELHRLRSDSARSSNGKRISLQLGPRERSEFFRHAREEWRARYPERCASNSHHLKRHMEWVFLFWTPVLMLAPFVAFNIYVYLHGGTEAWSPIIKKVNRLSILAVIDCGFFVCWWLWIGRKKFDEPSAGGNTAPPRASP